MAFRREAAPLALVTRITILFHEACQHVNRRTGGTPAADRDMSHFVAELTEQAPPWLSSKT